MLASQFPGVQFIQSRANIGFAAANNLGFAHSSGRAVLFLNPDTEIVGDALAAMTTVLDRTPDAGAVGARLLNSDGTVQTSCIQRFPTILNQAIDSEILRDAFPKLSFWGMGPLLEKQPAPVSVDVISGACMMVRRRAFEHVGLFTASYFMYSEDVDLCFKLHKAGYKNYYADDAVVVHHGGASASANGRLHFCAVVMRDGLSRFFALRYGKAYAAAYRASIVLTSIARCIVLGASIMLAPSSEHRFREALSRWKAVLRWGLGLNSVAAR
jgi:GT2 family glycosyltransferase